MLAQSVDSGQFKYNEKGAELTGGTYLEPNSSVVWRGLGFSANGPYDCAFALDRQEKDVSVTSMSVELLSGRYRVRLMC